MSKTNFEYVPPPNENDSTIITDTFLDSIFYTAGGHKHDGVNSDGHASIICNPLKTITNANSPYSFDGTLDHTILANAVGGAIIVDLPNATTLVVGQEAKFKKVDVFGNNITLTPFGSQTIDGAVSHILQIQYEHITLVTDGANWFEM